MSRECLMLGFVRLSNVASTLTMPRLEVAWSDGMWRSRRRSSALRNQAECCTAAVESDYSRSSDSCPYRATNTGSIRLRSVTGRRRSSCHATSSVSLMLRRTPS